MVNILETTLKYATAEELAESGNSEVVVSVTSSTTTTDSPSLSRYEMVLHVATGNFFCPNCIVYRAIFRTDPFLCLQMSATFY